MTSIHALVVRYANPFALHVIVSSIVLLIALAASYLPRLSARTRFTLVAAGVAKFLLPASLFAPFISRKTAAAVMQMAMPTGCRSCCSRLPRRRRRLSTGSSSSPPRSACCSS